MQRPKPLVPSLPGSRPVPPRVRDLARAAAALGLTIDKKGGKGSHMKFRGPDGRCYTVPASNGTKSEVKRCYISGLCRAFGLDEEEFRKKL